MAYTIVVECDNKTCDQVHQVPQVGQMPVNWIAVRMHVPEIVIPNGQQQTTDPGVRGLAFCSQECVITFLSNRTVAPLVPQPDLSTIPTVETPNGV